MRTEKSEFPFAIGATQIYAELARRAKNVSKYSNILMPSRASYFFRPDDATTSMALKQK